MTHDLSSHQISSLEMKPRCIRVEIKLVQTPAIAEILLNMRPGAKKFCEHELNNKVIYSSSGRKISSGVFKIALVLVPRSRACSIASSNSVSKLYLHPNFSMAHAKGQRFWRTWQTLPWNKFPFSELSDAFDLFAIILIYRCLFWDTERKRPSNWWILAFKQSELGIFGCHSCMALQDNCSHLAFFLLWG